VIAPSIIVAALFFAARECNNIQLRLGARMIGWLITLVEILA
jgi:hypothetical protein